MRGADMKFILGIITIVIFLAASASSGYWG